MVISIGLFSSLSSKSEVQALPCGVSQTCFLQPLCLALSASSHFPWSSAQMTRPIADLLGIVSMGYVSDQATESTLLLCGYVLSVAWLLAMGTAVRLYGSELLRKHKASERPWRPKWILRFIHSSYQLLCGAAFVPVLMALISPARCSDRDEGEPWLSSITCWSAEHQIMLALSMILGFSFSLWAAACSLLHVQTHFAEPDAKVHGRAHAVSTVLRAASALAVTTAGMLSTVMIIMILSGCIALELYLWVGFVPYRSPRLNSALISGSSGALFVMAAFALSQVEGAPYRNAEWGIVVCLPLVCVAAFMGGQEHMHLIASSKATLRNPYEIERYVRSTLYNSAQFILHGIDEATRASMHGSLDDHEEAAPGIQALGVGLPMRATLRRVEHILAQSHKRMPASKFLHLTSADFLRTWFNNPHIERSYVEAVLRLSPGIDEGLLAQLWSGQLEKSALRRDAKHLRIQERVQFEELKDDALSNELRARGFLSSFWSALGGRRPAVGRLIQLSADIEEAVDDAEESYDAMLSINRRNVSVLRSYAQFLGDVLNDPSSSGTLLMEAEAVEEEQSHEHTKRLEKFELFKTVSALDSSAENIAVVSISDQAKTLGHMTEVNAAVCSAFGYTRAELLGKNISMLLPEPIASMHDRILSAYLRSGKAKSIGSVRQAFGVHSTGYIFPLLLAVRSLRSGFGGLMQSVATKHSFIFFGTRSTRVVGACKSSLSLLQTTPDTISGGSVYLAKYLRGWKQLRHLAHESRGQDDEYFWEGRDKLAEELRDSNFLPDTLQGGCWGSFRNVSPTFSPVGQAAVVLSHIVQRTGKRTASCRAWMKMQLLPYPIQTDKQPPQGKASVDTLGVLMWEAGLPHTEVKELLRSERDGAKHSALAATVHATAAVHEMTQRKSSHVIARFSREEPHHVDTASDDNSNDADSLADLLDDALTDDGESAELPLRPADVEADSKRSATFIDTPSVATMVAMDSCHSAHVLLPSQREPPAEGKGSNTLTSSRATASKPLVSVLKKTNSFNGISAVEDVVADTSYHRQPTDGTHDAFLRSTPTASQAFCERHDTGLSKQSSANLSAAEEQPEPTGSHSATHSVDGDRASSVGSSDSQAAISSVLRRTVVQANEKPEAAVLSLRRSVIVVLSLTVFFIVAGAVTLSILLGTYRNSLGLLHDCAERQVQGEELMLLAQDQRMLALSLQERHDARVLQEFNAGRQQVLDLLETFNARHQGVYSSIFVLAYASVGQDDLHTKTPLNLITVEKGQEIEYERMLNDAVFEFMGHLRVVAASSAAELAADREGHLQWLQLNARASLMPALNKSSMLMDETFQNMAADSEGIQLGLLAASVSLLALVALCMVIPMSWLAVAERDRIWQLLFNIPLRVITVLQQRTESRMNALRAQSSDGDVQLEPDDFDDVVSDDFSSLSRVQFRQSSGRKEGRKLASSACDIVWTVVVFILPLLVAVAYYGGTFIWSAQTTDTIAGSGHTLLWSYHREAWSLTLLGTLMASMVENNGDLAMTEVASSLRAADTLSSVQQQLLYGDGQIQGVRVSQARTELMLHDGCVSTAAAGVLGCDGIYSGVLLNGAQAGVAEFVRRSRLILISRAGQIESNTTTCRLQRIRTAEMDDLRLFGKVHLRESLRHASVLVSDYTDGTIAWFSNVHTILTGSVIGVLILGFFGLQVPIMQRLDEQVKQSRATLLYLPPAAVEDIPALRQLLVLAGVVSASQLKRIKSGVRDA